MFCDLGTPAWLCACIDAMSGHASPQFDVHTESPDKGLQWFSAHQEVIGQPATYPQTLNPEPPTTSDY